MCPPQTNRTGLPANARNPSTYAKGLEPGSCGPCSRAQSALCGRLKLQTNPTKAQRVADHRDGREAHCGGCDHRREQQPKGRIECARSDRHKERVVYEGKKEVLSNISHCRPREAPSTLDAPQIAAHEGHDSTLHRDVCACAHCDAYLSLRERRRIVYTDTGHCDHVPLTLKVFYDIRLLLREHLSDHFVKTEPGCDCVGCGTRVAGQHNDAKPFVVELRNRFRRRFLDRIGHAEKPSGPAIYSDKHRSLTFAPEAFCG